MSDGKEDGIDIATIIREFGPAGLFFTVSAIVILKGRFELKLSYRWKDPEKQNRIERN